MSRALSEWTRGRRGNDNRILIQIVGVDADFREDGKIGNVTAYTLKDLPAGATVRVKIIAQDGSLGAPDGPKGGILME